MAVSSVSRTKRPPAILPIEFSVGFINSEEEDWIHRAIQKLDPDAYTRTPPPQKVNIRTGVKLRKVRFCMIVNHGQEKPLFFKLKLKYPEFKRGF